MLDAESQKANLNIRESIDTTKRFPDNVFLGEWVAYLFFDSDWIFDSHFHEVAKNLMALDRSGVTVLSRLGTALGDPSPLHVFSIQADVDSYAQFVRDAEQRESWLMTVGRFGCASTSGGWCIYCECESELAVAAVHDPSIVDSVRTCLSQFSALPIEDAFSVESSYALSGRVTPLWRQQLIKEYGF